MLDKVILAEMYAYDIPYILPLTGRNRGEADAAARRIWVNWNMTPAEIRCTVMHEIAHVAFGHEPTGDAELDAEADEVAERWAAAKLISANELAWALENCREDREAAEMLNVDMNTLRARIRARDCDHTEAERWLRRRSAPSVPTPTAPFMR